MAMLTVYTLSQCSTCREATKWLRSHGITFVEKPIRETPPTILELRAMLAHYGGDLHRLFNTAGREFRALNLKEKLPAISEADSLALLASNGSLVKRPFLIGPKLGLVGFDKTAWSRALV